MGALGKFGVDVEVKSDAAKVWSAIKDLPNSFSEAVPDHYKSFEIVEGDHHLAVGSVRLVKYAEGNSITMSKEKIDVIDDATKTLAYTVLEGDAMEYYKEFKAKVVVEEKGDGSLVKWSCEFEKAKEEESPLTPDHLKEFAVATLKKLDDYLLKA
ncbi:hypothetical protein RND81_07G172800 [Saponaria officinalis]|uniref:Bet v I/Major latex protein domain-containing protein n=1 Tax=Saponaria officinalis TaxID=3572 RepID=A0AAW1JRN5_SAPOF